VGAIIAASPGMIMMEPKAAYLPLFDCVLEPLRPLSSQSKKENGNDIQKYEIITAINTHIGSNRHARYMSK
jgi:hypothetical protein